MHTTLKAFSRILTACALVVLCTFVWTCGGDKGVGPTATQLAITVGPTTTTGGATLAPALKVEARDGNGNLVATYSGTITVALGTNPSGATLSGTKSAAAASGVATFADLSVDKVGAGYTLTATASGLTGATSTAFTINLGPAAKLSFSAPPSNATAGVAIAPDVTVSAQDLGGNLASGFSGNISVAITGGTGTAGATLSGTVTKPAVAGVATFSNLTVDKSGAGFTLSAASTGLTTGTSVAFTIAAGSAAQLTFTVQPSTTVAGTAMSTSVKVTAQDALGNTVTGYASTITVAITAGTGTVGATLAGTTTASPTNGVATFSGLSIDKTGRTSSGTGYTLSATSGALPSGTSDPFDINVGPPATLAFTTQPAITAAGAGFAPLVEVSARDAAGNVVTTFTGTVTVAIGTNPTGASLIGTAAIAAVGGVATFPTIHINQVGAGYTLSASATSIAGAVSGAFVITPGPAAELVFTAQPVTTSDAVPISPAVRVTARDAFGNDATQFAGNVTMAIASNPSAGTLSGTTTLAASAGVATFANLAIDNIGSGYTLSADASGLTPDTSAAFNIVVSSATKLVFTVQPSPDTAGGHFAPAILVTAQDISGQPVTTFTAPVAVAITGGTGKAGATLSGTTTQNAVLGVATFNDLSIDSAATGYTLTATGGGLQPDTSASFTITAGTATQLFFTVQPSTATAGAAIAPQVEVTARDGLGNTATAFTGLVTVAFSDANASGGTLSGTLQRNAVNGVATFNDLRINLAQTGHALSATATGLAGATSASFDISAAQASHLVFTTQPGGATAGFAIAGLPLVTVQDSLGNTVTSFTDVLTLTITAGTGASGATLSNNRATAIAGQVLFYGLSIDKAGTGYTLSATAPGVSGATSAPFNILPNTAVKLAFTVEPNSAPSGAALGAVKVTAQDSLGNTQPNFTGAVTVAIGTNPSAGTLSGTATMNLVAGVATFPNLSIDRSGTGYTLSATGGGLTAATSAPFDIAAGVATQLVFTVQPSTSAAGLAIAPTILVAAEDALGNTVAGFVANVTVAIANNPPGTGLLSGTKVVGATAGVASFSTLSINKSALGYTLSATAAGLPSATSAPFTITPGLATTLVFSAPPTNTTTNANIAPAVKVAAQDAAGNIATGFNGNVTVNIGSNPGSSTLSGTRTLAAVNGVATYQALSLNNTGTGYTLTAAGGGLIGATSGPFNIITSVGTQLFFTVNPPNTTAAGATISPSVVVTARDVSGQTASSFTGNVTVAITAGTGAAGAALSGTKTQPAVGGVATFTDLGIDKSAVGYKLTATASGLTSATSAFFTITPGAATLLVFTLPPSTATVATAITPKVEVTARDAQGNTATGFTGSVTVAIGTNPSNGVLAGTVQLAAVGGIASFSTLSINLAGTGYTLTAASGALAGATSTTFDITSTLATQLTFSTQPSAATAGAVIAPAVKVTARDASGGVATGFTGNVTLTITAGTGTAGSTLSGTVTKPAVLGVATFSNLSIDNSGSGFRLSATAAGVSGTTSSPFTINAGAATRVTYTVQPGTTTAASFLPGATGPTIQVTTRDALGNPVKTYTGSVTVALSANPPGGTLAGTKTVSAVAGVASFNDLTLDKSGAGYRLAATAAGLAPDTSDAFSITAGAARQLLFTVQPSNAAAGVAIAPAMRVTALDSLGNIATGFTGNVTLAIAINPSGGTLSGIVTVAAANGVAVFTGLSINNAGAGYVLKATAAGLTVGLSSAFNIN